MLQHLEFVFKVNLFVLAIKVVPEDHIVVGDEAQAA